MNILVVGASGRVGKKVVHSLANKGHHVLAGARKVEKIDIENNVEPIFVDLANEEADALAEKMANVEAIIFAAGSRGENLLQVDAFGAVKVMQATEKAKVKRFVMLSAMFSLNLEHWHDPHLVDLLDYYIAKFFADNYLISNTKLAYTILQPGALVEEKYTGLIETNVKTPKKNSLENVAETLAVIVETPETIGKIISMGDGDTPIHEALIH